MKTVLFSTAALAVGLIPTAPAVAATPEPVSSAGTGWHDPHHHVWYVHYRHHHGGHHVAGPFHTRHAAEHHADQLRHSGYHIERIVRD